MIFRRVDQPIVSRRRLSPSFLLSLGVHFVVAVALMRMLILHGLSASSRHEAVPAERIGFLQLPHAGTGAPTSGKSGGDGKRVIPREVHVVAPLTIPTTVPSAPAATVPKPEEEGGSGPLVGTGGPARGIRPSYTDPRVWTPPGKVVTAPKTVAQTIDSMIADAIAPYNDSVARAAQQRDPTDWTVEKGGQKWGIDRRAIRLGPVSIPTALLAMLPLNIQGNPMTMERDRAYAAMHRDITWHAQQAINDADFMKAVRSIRERKERERAAALSSQPASAPKEPAGGQDPH